MKIAVPCPHGCGYMLEWDMSKDHQHVQCQECGCVFCGICVTATAKSVSAEERLMYERMSKAHLN